MTCRKSIGDQPFLPALGPSITSPSHQPVSSFLRYIHSVLPSSIVNSFASSASYDCWHFFVIVKIITIIFFVFVGFSFYLNDSNMFDGIGRSSGFAIAASADVARRRRRTKQLFHIVDIVAVV